MALPDSLKELYLGDCPGITGWSAMEGKGRKESRKEGLSAPPQKASALLQCVTRLGSLLLPFRAGDVAQMQLPASLETLNLWITKVTGACEEDPHPRVSVTRKEVRPRRKRHASFCEF